MNTETESRYNRRMAKSRIEEIDFIKAISTIGFIVIHVLSFNLANRFNHFVWNYLHFVEVGFIFCSGYVLAARYQNFMNWQEIKKWYGKRLLRLLFPFYLYLIAHYVVWFLLPSYFSGIGLQKSFSFVLQSIFLIGGVSLGWLPLLFLQMTILFPIFIIVRRKKFALPLILIFSLLAGVAFMITPFFKPYYRFVMWIPWSFILLLSISAYMKESVDTKKIRSIIKRLLVGLVVLILFLILFLFWNTKGSINLTSHKYPPDLYFLFYGIGMSSLVSIIGYASFFKNLLVKNIVTFVSKQSYSLFFIHFIVLDFVITGVKKSYLPNSVFFQLAAVFFLSCLIVLSSERSKKISLFL